MDTMEAVAGGEYLPQAVNRPVICWTRSRVCVPELRL